MKAHSLEDFYKNVPPEQKEKLFNFRKNYPPKSLEIAGRNWQYLYGGSGDKAIAILAGGLGQAEPYETILRLEESFKVLSPSYPPVKTLNEIIEGIIRILDSENIEKVTAMGSSLGGGVAQVLAAEYPTRVENLILMNTALPVRAAAGLTKVLVGIFKILPEKTVIGMMKKQIDKMVKIVPDEEKALSKAYFEEHFSGSVGKADVVSLFDYVADYHKNYGDVAKRLESWPGKVLIMESDDDPRAPAKHRKALREAYPEAEVHTFHKAGHSVMLRYREECIAKIKKFLA